MNAVKTFIAIAAIGVAGWLVYDVWQQRQTAGLNNRAMDLIGQSKFAEARDLLEQARRRSPGNAVIWKNLGAAYEGLKEIPKAIEAYEQSLAINSAQTDLRDNVAILKGAVENEKKKAAKLQAELTDKPNDAQLLARIGATYENLDEFSRAIEMYEKSLKLDPNQADVRARLDALKKK